MECSWRVFTPWPRVTAPSTPAFARCHSVKATRTDAHREVFSIAVLNSCGKLMMEWLIETRPFLGYFQRLSRIKAIES
jgi:hypothetical protein